MKEEVDPKAEDKSSSIPIDDLVSTLRSFGKTSSKPGTIGNLREPEPFTGRDPKKLKPFLFHCQLYFWGSSKFEDDSKRVTFALSYLQDVAQEWFKPGLSGLTDIYPQWLDSWDLFVDKLQTTLGLLTSLPMLNMNLPISG